MGGRVTRTARVVPVVFGVAFGVSFLVPATPAAAHNSLTGSDPRDGARVATAPAQVELRFLAKPAPATTKITITGPDNVVAGGPPAFDGSRVRVPFKPAAAGLYIVGYQLASSRRTPGEGRGAVHPHDRHRCRPVRLAGDRWQLRPDRRWHRPERRRVRPPAGRRRRPRPSPPTAGATAAGSPVPAAQGSGQIARLAV